MTTVVAPVGNRPAAHAGWFRSAPYDLLLILGVPLLSWPLLMAGQASMGAARLNELILLTATGHYFATFVRAYGDVDLFRRFRTRFLLVPAVLLTFCVGMFTTGHGAELSLVTTAWAFWHWLAQAFGFARIYDSKVGSFRPWTAFLDKALVVAGFTGTVILNPSSTATFAATFYDAGVPLPGGAAFGVVKIVTAVLVGIVAIAYVANLAATIARGLPWSWQKQLMHVSTIGYYWFAFSYLPSLLIAYVLYEFFHDVQYYAITWLTCGQRARRSGVAPWFAAMFRPRFATAAMFVAAMCALGGLDALARHHWWPEGLSHQVWNGVVITLAVLHYYYDGFIWKAREGSLAKDLGITGGRGDARVPGLRHAAWFLVFLAPPVVLMNTAGNDPSTRARLAAIVAVAPDDFDSHSRYALELTGAGDLQQAFEHHRRALELNPDHGPLHYLYGAALDLVGDTAAAKAQFERVLTLPDIGDTHRQAHLRLGSLLWLAGDRAGAAPHLATTEEEVATIFVGLAAALPPAAAQRRTELMAAAQSRLQVLKDAVAAAPDDVGQRYRLAQALAGLDRIREAHAALELVLRAQPGHAGARALQQQLPR